MRFGIMLALLLAAGCATTHPARQAAPASGEFNVLAFGAKADGKQDDTAALQKAIDAASVNGGTVLLPAGQYRVNDTLAVKPGVMLKGAYDAPAAIAPLKGTVILAYGGRDNEAAPALFELGQTCSVSGLTVWYPEQKPTDIRPYPWTFHLQGFDNTVENVTLINSYNGIHVGPEPNVRHRIRSVVGCVLRRGLFVDGTTDIGRIENVQWHCHWWSDPATGGVWEPVFNYMIANCEAFVFGRTDWEYVTNNFVFPAKVGFRFIKTAQGACNGHFTANGADACETAVLVDDIQPMGLLFTGGQFVAFTGKNPVEVRVSDTNRGNIRFVNCAFWGPADYNAVIQGQGFVSFSDCYFSSGKNDNPDRPLLDVQSGRVQIDNCTFATPELGVAIGAQVKHAIVRGNNGVQGVRIRNDLGSKAIIAENEPEAKP